MKKKVFELIATIVKAPVETLDESSGPATVMGWNSLSQITLLSALEQDLNVEFSMKEMTSVKTLGDILQLLREKGIAVD